MIFIRVLYTLSEQIDLLTAKQRFRFLFTSLVNEFYFFQNGSDQHKFSKIDVNRDIGYSWWKIALKLGLKGRPQSLLQNWKFGTKILLVAGSSHGRP